MYKPLCEHNSSILSPKQTGFHFAQHYVMFMIEQFKESRDKRGEFGAVFTVLSKRFDCIDHNLLITKLFWYRVTLKSHDIISSYLSSQNKILGQIIVIVEKVILNMVLHRVWCWDRYYLILISLTCWLNVRMLTFDDTIPYSLFPIPNISYSCAKDISSVISKV